MTRKRDAVMPDPTDDRDARALFREEIREHIGDVAALCAFVSRHPSIPIPSPDEITPRLWSAEVQSEEEFEELARVLGSGVPVEREAKAWTCVLRRRFGTVALELWQRRHQEAS